MDKNSSDVNISDINGDDIDIGPVVTGTVGRDVIGGNNITIGPFTIGFSGSVVVVTLGILCLLAGLGAIFFLYRVGQQSVNQGATPGSTVAAVILPQNDTPPPPILSPTATSIPATAMSTATLMPTPTAQPTSTLTDTHHPPQLFVEQLYYTINGGPEQSARRADIIPVTKGEQLCLLRLEYNTDDPFSDHDTTHGEVYPVRSVGIFWSDPESWLVERVAQRVNNLTIINPEKGNGCWIIKEGWDGLLVLLYHHNSRFGSEIDDQFSVKLMVQAK